MAIHLFMSSEILYWRVHHEVTNASQLDATGTQSDFWKYFNPQRFELDQLPQADEVSLYKERTKT